MNLNRVTTRSGIVIGLLHCERAPLHSADAESIQTALLSRRRANGLARAVGAAILVRFLRKGPRKGPPRPIPTQSHVLVRAMRAVIAFLLGRK